MRIALLTLLGLICQMPGWAQEPVEFGGFHRLPLDDALSQNTVATMLQDSRGLMWFGTLGGLNVYDGYRFEALPIDPRDPEALAGVSISQLLQDSRGRIWVAGAAGWLDRVDPVTREITHVAQSVAGASDRPGSNAMALHEDAAGNLWIGSNTGLHRYDAATDTVQMHADARGDAPPPLSAVTAIVAGDEGRLWLGTPNGLARFNPDTGDIEHFRHRTGDPDSLVDDRVTALLLDSDRTLWVGTREGLSRREAGSDAFQSHVADFESEHALAGNYVRTLLQDSRGRIWVGTQSGGLNLYRNGRFQSFQHDPDNPQGISSDDVWSLFEDRTGLLWIGTAGGGLNQINPSTQRFNALRSLPFNARSLRNPFVWDIAEDADGNIWMTTLAGLERWNPRSGDYSLFQPRPGANEMNQLQSLHIDPHGSIWVGSVNGMLYRFDPLSAEFTSFARESREAADDGSERYSSDRVWFIGGSAQGALWIAVSEGLFELDPESGTSVELIGPRADIPMGVLPVRAALTDSDGVIWFGGGGAGLVRYEPGKGVTAVLGHKPGVAESLSNNGVRSMVETPDGSLWIGTQNGLNRLSAEDRRASRNRFTLYTTVDGLPNNTAYGILPEPGSARLWISTNAGLGRLDPETGEFARYTVADGLTANEMNGGAELLSSRGLLYFGSVNGVTWFDPAELPINAHAPAVAITSIERHLGDKLRTRLTTFEELEFPHDATAFTVDFAVMDFHQPQKNRFRYRLHSDGAGEWVDTEKSSISFAMLPPGKHRLEVQGANNDGVWSESPATLQITVKPPWWRTSAAYAAEALLLGLVLLLYHLGQHRKLARERGFTEEISRAYSLAEARHLIAEHQARFDQLTQLPNRFSLIGELGRYLREARTGREMALLLINLDRFQQVNDSIGHAFGDRVLQVTAERLQTCLGENDFLARVGSDEFALVAVCDLAQPQTDWPEQLAARVQREIAEPHVLKEPPLIIGASVGIACYAPDIGGPSDLLGFADIAVHDAKRQGRLGAVMRYRTGMRESVSARLSIEGRMRRALEAGEFAAHYQPLLVVSTGRLCGFEALIRWFPPDAAPIFPDQFIPVAEDSGMIVELGHWMLRETCRQLAEWRKAGVNDLYVAVNVSMRQLRSGTLPAQLRAALDDFGVLPRQLKLEITESAMMENVEDTAEQLTAIRSLGVPISVDDFGTGFSSLAHLKRLPVSELKIDRSFIADVVTSEQSRMIVASIVRLAHELNLSTVGEGVEDAASLECLRAIGCDLAQGYHFARPMSAAQLRETGWLDGLARRRA